MKAESVRKLSIKNMRNYMFRILSALLLILTPGLACGLTEIDEKMTSKIDALFMPFDHDGSPGYAVGVVQKGKLIYSRGYGRAELDYNMAITPTSSFHLASLSKQFVAASIALLIQERKLSLETPVASFFPEAKKYGEKLKIKHLIYFTSGLTEYTSLKRANGMSWFSFDYFTTDKAIATSFGVP
jgi:CubicO group peptidase (beta-lactamase class C family)